MSSYEDILVHLQCVDKCFIVPLSMRVDMTAYAKKIFEKAVRLEAWCDNQLIGLVAYYKNADLFFITNVSVCASYSGIGIATFLLRKIKQEAIENDVHEIIAEMDEAIVPFYQKQGFIGNECLQNNNVKMIYKIIN